MCAPVLRIDDIRYSIEGRPLFDGATATIPTGHKVGFVGRNGTGKTTLFRLIREELELDAELAVRPRDPQLRFLRAVILDRMKRWREAIDELYSALAIEAEFFEARALLGSILTDVGEHEPALDAFAAARSLRPTDERLASEYVDALYAAAIERLNASDGESAAEHLGLALELLLKAIDLLHLWPKFFDHALVFRTDNLLKNPLDHGI